MSDRKLKIAIIGAGSRGIRCFGKHIDRTENAEITALCEPNKVRARVMSQKLERSKPRHYTNIEDMIDNEPLDACIVTSPDYCHAENAVAALKKGVNVLIDKPMATTVKACKDILKAAEESGKTVMTGFNLRHSPVMKKLKEIVDDGILGRVFLIENREFYQDGTTYMSRWNRKYEFSGGLWVHKGSHDFDIFNWLLGFPNALKVSSVAGISVFTEKNIPFEVSPQKPVGPTCGKCVYQEICPDKIREFSKTEEWGDEAYAEDNYYKDLCMYASDKNVHDNGIAIVEYENGVRASHMECFVTPVTGRFYTVIGDRGQAEVSLRGRQIIVRSRWGREVITYDIPEVTGGHGGADPSFVSTFLEVISGDKPNTSTAEHGMLSVAIGQAAEISAREGRTVYVKELMES